MLANLMHHVKRYFRLHYKFTERLEISSQEESLKRFFFAILTMFRSLQEVAKLYSMFLST